jgi:hypothetical protein
MARPALHVVDAWTERGAVVDPERHFGQRADPPHRVRVSEEEQARAGAG